MTVLVVGSVALDSVETPFGKAENVLGGSGTFFSASASHCRPVQLVGVIGSDYPIDKLEKSICRSADRSRRTRDSRRRVIPLARTLPSRPQHGRDARDTPRCVLAFPPEDSRAVPQRAVRVSWQHRSATSARGAQQVDRSRKLVACDTMNFWIESRRADVIDAARARRSDHAQRRARRASSRTRRISCGPRDGSWSMGRST